MILITGANGFIGSHLTKKIKGDILLTSSKRKKGHIKLDLISGNYKILKKYKINTCIHLAWSGIPDYSQKNSHKNYIASKKFFDFLINNGCKKIISIGSCWEYKENFGAKKEISKEKSENIFGNYKKRIAQYGLKLSKNNNITFTWLRLFYVIGDTKKGLMKYVSNCVIKNKKINLNFPNKYNDFILVDDVVKCIIKCVKNDYSGIFNLGSGKKIKTITFCKSYLKLLNQDSKKYLNTFPRQTKKNGIWANMDKTNEIIKPSILKNLNLMIKKSLNYL